MNDTKLIRLNRPLADWLKAEAAKSHRTQTGELAMILEAEQERRKAGRPEDQKTTA